MRPVPAGVGRAGIEAFAERVRAGVQIGSGFDLKALLARNGSRTQMADIAGKYPHGLLVNPDGTFTVFLSSFRSACENHGVMAIEIGHRLLHWPKVRAANPGYGMSVPRLLDRSDEMLMRCRREAQWFAAAFLMPECEVRTAWADGGIEGVSDRFAVTVDWARARLRRLGIEPETAEISRAMDPRYEPGAEALLPR
ncbi:ImmA/IrrE family metallo-endopeptidase [Leisingera sp. XS_AS12]|uniref:ImmA/IrrE family metallo-endopeptidase n=1 Tax=Leisingera sp. XS_AS12 TaxID=3241294 RepID=UPI00351785CC